MSEDLLAQARQTQRDVERGIEAYCLAVAGGDAAAARRARELLATKVYHGGPTAQRLLTELLDLFDGFVAARRAGDEVAAEGVRATIERRVGEMRGFLAACGPRGEQIAAAARQASEERRAHVEAMGDQLMPLAIAGPTDGDA